MLHSKEIFFNGLYKGKHTFFKMISIFFSSKPWTKRHICVYCKLYFRGSTKCRLYATEVQYFSRSAELHNDVKTCTLLSSLYLQELGHVSRVGKLASFNNLYLNGIDTYSSNLLPTFPIFIYVVVVCAYTCERAYGEGCPRQKLFIHVSDIIIHPGVGWLRN